MAGLQLGLESKLDPTDINEAKAVPSDDYFTTKTSSDETAETAEPAEPAEDAPRRYLSRNVTDILDQMETDLSDSDEEDAGNGSEGKKGADDRKPSKEPHRDSRHPLAQTHNDPSTLKPSDFPVPKPGSQSAAPPRKPHAARFHSLRSILFSTRLEDEQKKSAAQKKKEHHEARKSPQRTGQTTPPQLEKRDSFSAKLSNKLKRVSSSREQPSALSANPSEEAVEAKSTPNEKKLDGPAQDIPEVANAEQEASPPDSDAESLGHGDVDDLVKWATRRDELGESSQRILQQGSNSGLATSSSNLATPPDHGAESEDNIGQEDVDELVNWVSTRQSRGEGGDGQCLSTIQEDGSAPEEKGKRKWLRRTVTRMTSKG